MKIRKLALPLILGLMGSITASANDDSVEQEIRRLHEVQRKAFLENEVATMTAHSPPMQSSPTRSARS